MSQQSQQFQVDLRGVVDLLSRHIYSSPRVFLRELLQNARDAITARREIDGSGGEVSITPLTGEHGEFVLRDDGVGLTADEVTELLATVGRSSKRDIFDLPRQDYLGQFGIGLLSCFMVADEIVIRSRSARGGDPVEWTGRSDGTFTVGEAPASTPIGTSVHLRPRFDAHDLLSAPAVLQLTETFAEFLPVSIRVHLPGGGEQRIGRQAAFLQPHADPEATRAYGAELLGAAPMAAIPIDVPATGTRGVAYVLPFAPPPGSTRSARVYLGGMLLGERIEQLLPEWAFFVRCVVDSTALSPTASRESLVDDEALEITRTEIGGAIRRWVLELGLAAPHMLAQFVSVHELALKSLVLHDEELAQFITRWLTVETTIGRMPIGDLVARCPRIRVAASLDEFRQVASITTAEIPLVNGGYMYDAELMQIVGRIFPDTVIDQVDVLSEFDRLDPPPLDDRDAAIAFEARATKSLAEVECTAIVRSLEQSDVPSLYVADPAVLRRLDRSRSRGVAGALWAGVLNSADEAAAQQSSPDQATARLCINWASPVVRDLRALDDDAAFDRTVQLLYVQALLAGQRPLTERDRSLMTRALSEMIRISATPAALAAIALPEDVFAGADAGAVTEAGADADAATEAGADADTATEAAADAAPGDDERNPHD